MKLHWPSVFSWRVIGVTVLFSLTAGMFGFDTGSIGSITTMKDFENEFGVLSPLMRGVVVSIILVPSGATGVLAGSLSDRLSRKRTIALGAAIFAVGSVISAAAKGSLGVLLLGRCVAGAGEGCFLGCLGVVLSELAPRHLRAQMMLLQQCMCTGAIAAAFFVCYGTVNIPNSLSWRLPFILQAITGTFVAVIAPFMPYSPRWLLAQGRREEAEKVLDLLLDPRNIEERREMLSVGPASVKLSMWEAAKDIWAPGVRGRTSLGMALNVFQQLSGIDFVLFYAPSLFEQAGLDPATSSFVASGVTGLILLACSCIGASYINKVGRRKIWLVGGTATASCHFVLGMLYATGAARQSAGQWAGVVFIELFAVSFTSSWSLVTKLYAAEIQPSRTRSAATSFGQGVNQLVNFAVAVSGPFFLAQSSYGPYFCYGGFTALGVVFAFFFMPEVLGKTLESIDETFEGSPVAVAVPTIFQRARLTEVRQRKNSRSQSATLSGETREDIRRHMELQQMPAIGEDTAVDEDDDEDTQVK